MGTTINEKVHANCYLSIDRKDSHPVYIIDIAQSATMSEPTSAATRTEEKANQPFTNTAEGEAT